MDTTNVNLLKEFRSVLNRKALTEEAYQYLLKQYDLDKKDLQVEMEKINQKKSGLSRSRRAAVPEFIALRKILDEKKQQEMNSISMNTVSDNIQLDQIKL